MKRYLFTLFIILFINTSFNGQDQISIIPKPISTENLTGSYQFKDTIRVSFKGVDSYIFDYLKNGFESTNLFKVKKVNKGADIELSVNKTLSVKDEGYILEVNNNKITIIGKDKSGVFNGIQTLYQLLPPSIYSGNIIAKDNWSIKNIKIEDYPNYPYRGLMLDVSRTFFDLETVKKLLVWMAYHKLNKFHWHLTDDNGWRVEIKKYPLLTKIGAWRGVNEALSPSYGSGEGRYGGFYTQKQIKEIVDFANKLNIEIIPEIELPGHSRAITASYPNILCSHSNNSGESVQGEVNNVWCVSKESNYKMLDNIIKELSKLFPSNFIHIGGDEVNMSSWKNCPDCIALMDRMEMKDTEELQNYFVGRLEKIVEKHGKKMAGWDEILDGGELHKSTRVYAWRSLQKGIESVKKGQPTILMPSPHAYLDMKQSDLERGHNWAGIVTLEKTYSLNPLLDSTFSDAQKSLIVGVQGGLWTELLAKPPRFMEYQYFPRAAALAEVGWSYCSPKDFEDFKTRLYENHFPRLIQMGIAFRVEPPKVTYTDSSLVAVSEIPGAIIRYTNDESNPEITSPIYSEAIKTSDPVKYRFSTFLGNSVSSISVKAYNIDYKYLSPKVTIESSIEEGVRYKYSSITDYDFNTAFRSSRKVAAGEYLIFRFEEPIKVERLTVTTGLPKIEFYGITNGYAEYSLDGINYEGSVEFKDYKSTLYPKKEIKSVRIVISSTNDANTLVFQDLMLE